MEDSKKKIFSVKIQRNILLIIILLIGIKYLFNGYTNLTTKLAISEQNQKALLDSVRISENKIKDLVFSKNILIAEKGNLKDLNNDLAQEVKKEKGKVRSLNRIVSRIKSDTVFTDNTLILYKNGTKGLSWKYDTIFDANNERHISGISDFSIDSNGNITPLKTKITNDEFKFNLITGLKEVNGNVEIFVRSDYPGFSVTKLDGAIIDPNKHPIIKKFTNKKRWGIGPYVGGGINYNTRYNTNGIPNIGFGYTFGVGIHYSIIRF